MIYLTPSRKTPCENNLSEVGKLSEKAWRLRKKGDLKKALDVYTERVSRFSDRVEAKYAKGQIREIKSEIEQFGAKRGKHPEKKQTVDWGPRLDSANIDFKSLVSRKTIVVFFFLFSFLVLIPVGTLLFFVGKEAWHIIFIITAAFFVGLLYFPIAILLGISRSSTPVSIPGFVGQTYVVLKKGIFEMLRK